MGCFNRGSYVSFSNDECQSFSLQNKFMSPTANSLVHSVHCNSLMQLMTKQSVRASCSDSKSFCFGEQGRDLLRIQIKYVFWTSLELI